jgi:AraC-like DNA-binding protein
VQEYPGEHVAFVRPLSLPGVEVLVAERSPRLWRVYHDTYSICTVFDRGQRIASNWRYRARDHVATERSLMMMEPGELHVTKRLNHAGSFRVLMMDPSVVRAIARDCGHNQDVRLRSPQENAPPLYRAFAALHDGIDSDAEPLETQALFHEALCLWLEHCTEARALRVPAGSMQRLSAAVEYLHAHLAQPVTLTELSAIAGVTPWHLIRMFSRYVGCTPHRYQLRLRLTRARRMLSDRLRVVDVANAVGFCDAAALGRRFKEVWGVTPGRYVELVTGKKPLAV